MVSEENRPTEYRARLLGQIAHELTERLCRGEDPTAGEYIRQYPELAEDIRGLRAALMALRQPSTVVPQPRTAVATLPFPDAVDPSARSAVVSVIAPRPVGRHSLEIRALLHRRLLISALIGTAFVGIYLPTIVLPILFHSQGSAGAIGFGSGRMWLSLAVHSVVFGGALTVAVVLWSKPLLSVRTLRWTEAILWGIIAGLFAWPASELFYSGWVRTFAEYGEFGVTRLAGFTNVRFLSLIVAYGALIPNTWRRCLTVTTVMAAVPLTIAMFGGLMDEQIGSRAMRYFLVESVVWMSCAVAIAVFGSYRITKLQQQVYEARKLGPYQLKRRIGSGSMGEVYLAEHVLLLRPCAVKLIRPERAGNPDIVRRFLREVQVTATLTHPNTVQVFDYGQTEDGTLYYPIFPIWVEPGTDPDSDWCPS
jgi:hypothetical protein